MALTKQQKELLDYLGHRLQHEHELWTKRREFEGGSAEEKQQLFASLVPVCLVQSGDRYRLTLEGALEARYADNVRSFLDRVLAAMKQIAKGDRGFEQFSFKQLAENELYLQHVIQGDRDIRWLGHIIRIASLCAEPDSAPEKGPWKVPADIEEVLECKNVEELRARRTARSASSPVALPELTQRALDELVRLFLDGKNFYVEELALLHALRDLPKGQPEAASKSLIPALARGGSGRFTPTFRGVLSSGHGAAVRDLLKHFLSAIHTKWEKDGAFHQLLWRDVKAAASANAVVLDDKKLEWMLKITDIVWAKLYRAPNGPPDEYFWGRPDDLKEIVDNEIRNADELLALREHQSVQPAPTLAVPEPREEVAAVKPDPKKVFIIHGRDGVARDQMTLFLRALGLEVLTFDDASIACGGSAFIGVIVKYGIERASAVIALFTPDEHAELRHDLRRDDDKPDDIARWQSRPNVLFEAGMALGLDEDKTILVTLGTDVKLFSDVDGRHIIRLNNSTEKRDLLRKKLRQIGCSVREDGDWYNKATAGDFETVGVVEESKVNPAGESSGLSDTDQRMLLDTWTQTLKVGSMGEQLTLRYSKIDEEAGTDIGAAKKWIADVLRDRPGWTVREGDEVVTLRWDAIPF